MDLDFAEYTFHALGLIRERGWAGTAISRPSSAQESVCSRRRALAALGRGMPREEVADTFGVGVSSVMRYVEKVH
jgi:hypothetical protein